MNKELEELKRQKRLIEEKIKQIEKQAYVCGRAKIGIEHYPTQKPDRHYLAINTKNYDERYVNWKYKSILNAYSFEDIVKEMPEIIKDLQGLYEQVKEIKNEA